PVPEGLSMAEAAALPETLFTVWYNIFMRAGLRAGETLLVHGGTSGIGTMALSLARCLGVRSFATAGSDEKCKACTELGAELAINYREQDFVDAVLAHTGGDGVNVILDMVGGSYLSRNLRAAAVEGRIAQVAFLEGSNPAIDLMSLVRKRVTLTGSMLRSRSDEDKAMIARDVQDKAWPLVADGRLRPVMDQRFAMHDAAAAHARMEGGAHVGKIVLQVE
ncbi:MAG: zinc-binding dehydrogenase, partial [Devosia sp.]|nr:zinc-binding dehydrogenase [Devosia sp.]